MLFRGSFGFWAEREICNNYVAACFEKTRGESEGNTAATASNQGSLAIEIVDGHFDWVERYLGR